LQHIKSVRHLGRQIEAPGIHFFYFKFYPWIGSAPADPLEHLTKNLNGTAFEVRSPATLAEAIRKMRVQVDAARDPTRNKTD